MVTTHGMTRRTFIVRAAAAGLALPSLSMLLAACGDDGAGDTASPFAGSYNIDDADTGTLVEVAVANGVRTIKSNGLPNHPTGEFPNAGNPNTISAQTYSFTLPVSPIRSGTATTYNVPQPFGIAVNGVKIDPFAAEWYDNDATSGWQLAALANPLGFDDNNAHVQPNGAYHYHGVAPALITAQDRPLLIGWAGDGFPIYGPYGYEDPSDPGSPVVELHSSYRLKTGERRSGPGGVFDGTYIEDYEYVADSGDLDECNGRVGITPEHPEGTYHYVATTEWPSYGRCFAGEIADSFRVEPPAGVGPRDAGRGPSPRTP